MLLVICVRWNQEEWAIIETVTLVPNAGGLIINCR